MEKTAVQKLAGALKALVIITLVCSLMTLLLVSRTSLTKGPEELLALTFYENPLEALLRVGIAFVLSWGWVQMARVYEVILALFLLFYGICTVVILWQGRRVLGVILAGVPFRMENGVSLWRAAVRCFLIATAALVRVVRGLFYYGSVAPLLTYNASFVPIFILGGLLRLVMSVLFCQAAELKMENDLAIWGGEATSIVVNLDVMVAKRKMSLNKFSARVDITLANLSILKNNHAKTVCFTTLEAICKALDC